MQSQEREEAWFYDLAIFFSKCLLHINYVLIGGLKNIDMNIDIKQRDVVPGFMDHVKCFVGTTQGAAGL